MDANVTPREIRPIPGWPGYYASTEGGIFSTKRGGMVKLTPWVNHGGYETVTLHRPDGTPRGRILVHRSPIGAPC